MSPWLWSKMLSLVPDEVFVRQAKSEHLARWWGGLVGGGTMAGKGQKKRETFPITAKLGGEMLSTHRWLWKPEGL